MIYPQYIASEGILSKNPLSISTDGFLFITISTEIPTYKKRPGPYFYVDTVLFETEHAAVTGPNSNQVFTSINTGVASTPGVNRKRS